MSKKLCTYAGRRRGSLDSLGRRMSYNVQSLAGDCVCVLRSLVCLFVFSDCTMRETALPSPLRLVKNWLEISWGERAGALVYLKVNHAFDPVRSDPRIHDL